MNQIISPNGRYTVIIQDDGNLVVYEQGDAIWSTLTGPIRPPRGNGSSPQPGPVPPTNVVVNSVPGRLHRIPGPFHPRLYSYWANATLVNQTTYVFGGHTVDGPRFYSIFNNQITGPLGWKPLQGTTEGWYWVGHYIHVPDGPNLRRWNIQGSEPEEIVLSVEREFPGHRLWQCHSSDDGRVHSATLQNTQDWQFAGTVVSYRGHSRFFPPVGRLDESQVSRDGEWLIIKETDSQQRLFNRIIRLDSTHEMLLNPDARLGHSDCGHGFIVGEDSNQGAAVFYDLESGQRRTLFETWNMGHVSVRGRKALFSRHEHGRLDLMNLDTLQIEATFAHGVVSNDYDTQVRANLSPCGRRATFTWNGDLCVLEL